MKKLLVTAIGAAAALGAYAAGEISLLRFESNLFPTPGGVTTNELNQAHGTYWSELPGSTNTYAIEARTAEIVSRQKAIEDAPYQALSVKTTFGKPLSVNVVENGGETNINAGIYFDSLVKFTVCEDAPDQAYDNAKIVMWLQEQYDGDDNITGTNLCVRAGYLTGSSITNSSKVYVCGNAISGDFADKFHRVTIKAIADITATGAGIPGFAIYIDGNDESGDYALRAACEDAKWDENFTYALTEAADDLNKAYALFPSMIQQGGSKAKLTAASFDGTGSITDIIFTDNPPAFAKDYVAPKAEVTIGDRTTPYDTYADAVTAVNGLSAGTTATLKLKLGVTADGTLAFAPHTGVEVILDFAGIVITNTSDSVPAISVAEAAEGDMGVLIITNSTVAVGGVYCSDENGVALEFMSGELAIYGGIFDGEVTLDAGSDVFGGSYKDDTNVQNYLAPGKVLSEKGATYQGLYDVIDAPTTYTVQFFDDVEGSGQVIGEAQSVESGALAVAPAAPTKTGYTFVDWTPSTNVAISANTDFYPTWTANNYSITYYDGERALELAPATYTFGTGATLPASADTKAGYDFAGWYDNAQFTGDAVTAVAANATGNKTFYAKYTATTYTITFVPGDGASVDPVSTNYTIESGAITLPTPVKEVVGPTFDGWTNATVTTAIKTFTPTSENLGSFTLYAVWTGGGETYPTYIDTSDAMVKKQYDDWKALYGDDSGSSHEAAFLLNVAMDGDTTLDATAVTISGSTVTITLDHNNINGYPYYKAASTVAGLASATKVAITTERSGAVITLTGQSGDAKFYQIGISSKSDLSDD